MRSIWTGTIGFGLVNIPIKLYSAVQDSELNLDMLDKKDKAHIHFKRVNENTGKEVKWDNIVKAFDYEGKYVELSDEDFENAMPEKTKRIEIFQFVKEEEIESIYYESPYFIEPDKEGDKMYALLREALERTKMVGVGSFVLRNKEHLIVMKPYKNAIMVQSIRFQEEIRDTKDLEIPQNESIKAPELKMAMALVEQMAEPFNISAYRDTYTDKLMDIIKAKAEGTKLPKPKMSVVTEPTTDIMAQLKASLSKRKKAS
jgi:DNA end-binding protein Ku